MITKRIIPNFRIRVNRQNSVLNNYPEWDLIPAWEVKDGNNVLYIHKVWKEDLMQFSNPYINKRKGEEKYTISHKSGISMLVRDLNSRSIDNIIKLAEKCLKKRFFGFFYHYPTKKVLSSKTFSYKHLCSDHRTNKVMDSMNIIIIEAKKMKLI